MNAEENQRFQIATLEIPDRMQAKLKSFQRQVWFVKLAEGLLAASFGLLVSYLLVFALDRFIDTPAGARWAILIAGAVGLGIWFPWVCHKWIWGSRRMEQVAKLLRFKYPRLGDHLLGIIELVHNDQERDRSIALCRAALAQVDEETKDRDFTKAVPNARHRQWAVIAGVPALVAVVALIIVPAAGTNAFGRWLMPWKNIERYTFTQVNAFPDQLIVPTAETSTFNASLAESSRWNPASGSVTVNGNRVNADNKGGEYSFHLPPMKSDSVVNVSIGDVRKQVTIQPKSRPELSSLVANIQLPEYLQRSAPVSRDIRGGSVSLVQGSRVSFRGVATRELVEASINDQPLPINGEEISTGLLGFTETSVVSLRWQDVLGLSSKAPLNLKVRVGPDAEPSLVCRQLEKQRVILEKDVLSFEVDCGDDFGVKTIGMEWKGAGTDENETPVIGEKIVSAGSPDTTDMTKIATFSPKREGVHPQAIELRVYVEDYFPGRERVYSPTFTVFVLSEEEHAVWLTSQISEWSKIVIETYDREKTLRAENDAIRKLSDQELDRPESRRRIESQVAAEQAQSRRLAALTRSGKNLVQEAARNDQFNVATIEELSEMILALDGISNNQMPSVAGLLRKSASAASSGKPGKSGMSVSDDQSLPGANEPKPGDDNNDQPKKDKDAKPPKAVPSISIKESSMDKSPDPASAKGGSKASKAKLTLPGVALEDKSPGKPGEKSPAKKAMDDAVDEQDNLLAEFQKVAEELQKIISNLEGSTFVKRLKAMSRKQLKLAGDINETAVGVFGQSNRELNAGLKKRAELLAKRELEYVEKVGFIQDDLEAYANRVQEGKFKTVLAEMKSEQLNKQLAGVSAKIESNQPGSAISHTEILADNFDRWAEQLVGPG